MRMRNIFCHLTVAAAYGTGASITPDGVIVMADGTVLALDVVVVGTGDKVQETARRKRFGWGSLGALERAKRARVATWERVRLAEEDGSMGRRAAEEERQKAAGSCSRHTRGATSTRSR